MNHATEAAQTTKAREIFRVLTGRWSNGEGGFDGFNFDGCTGATAYEAVLEALVCDGMDIGAAADRISAGIIEA